MDMKKKTTKTSEMKKTAATSAPVQTKPQPKSKLSPEQLTEYIQTRAYYVWEEWGRPQGQEDAIWQQATKDIKKQFGLK